jgi:hypothetical protein
VRPARRRSMLLVRGWPSVQKVCLERNAGTRHCRSPSTRKPTRCSGTRQRYVTQLRTQEAKPRLAVSHRSPGRVPSSDFLERDTSGVMFRKPVFGPARLSGSHPYLCRPRRAPALRSKNVGDAAPDAHVSQNHAKNLGLRVHGPVAHHLGASYSVAVNVGRRDGTRALAGTPQATASGPLCQSKAFEVRLRQPCSRTNLGKALSRTSQS